VLKNTRRTFIIYVENFEKGIILKNHTDLNRITLKFPLCTLGGYSKVLGFFINYCSREGYGIKYANFFCDFGTDTIRNK